MDEKLILKYRDNFARLIQDEYCLGDKMYDFENHEELEDFEFKDYLYHYVDGRNCRILDYEWYLDGKWSHINNIKIELEDGEILENISPNKLYISYESYEDCRGYFIQDEYY